MSQILWEYLLVYCTSHFLRAIGEPPTIGRGHDGFDPSNQPSSRRPLPVTIIFLFSLLVSLRYIVTFLVSGYDFLLPLAKMLILAASLCLSGGVDGDYRVLGASVAVCCRHCSRSSFYQIQLHPQATNSDETQVIPCQSPGQSVELWHSKGSNGQKVCPIVVYLVSQSAVFSWLERIFHHVRLAMVSRGHF